MKNEGRRVLRIVARALTGSTYAVLGADAFRSPGGRVGIAAPLLDQIRKMAPLPKDDEVLVKVNAACQTVAGAALTVGLFPRLASATLFASMVPTTLAGHAYWTHEDPATRKAQRTQFHKNLAMLGGLLIVVLEASPAQDLRE